MARRPERSPHALLAALLLAACPSSASGASPGDIPDPVFADPVAKIARTGDRVAFSKALFDQYVYQDPYLVGATPLTNQVKFHGQVFTDPYPVTQAQQKQIWANYSAAYAEMARLFHGSGRTVRARAFARGAGATSAFWVECVTLHQLVSDGAIADFQCASVDFPSYRSAADWVDCPADCRPPTSVLAEAVP